MGQFQAALNRPLFSVRRVVSCDLTLRGFAMARRKAAAKSDRRGISFPVVAIGASAGGLAAFTALLKALAREVRDGVRADSAPRARTRKRARPAARRKATGMPVTEVANGMRDPAEPRLCHSAQQEYDHPRRRPAAGCHVRIPPGCSVPIDDLWSRWQRNTATQPSVSCSPEPDRTERYGLKAVKAAGGITFAEDTKTAQWRRHADERDRGRLGRFRSVAAATSPPNWRASAGIRISAEAAEEPEGSELDRICLMLRSARRNRFPAL